MRIFYKDSYRVDVTAVTDCSGARKNFDTHDSERDNAPSRSQNPFPKTLDPFYSS
jgi:hypothetical protein